MGCSRQKHWSGLPSPPPGGLPSPGAEPVSLCLLHWQAGSLPLAPPGRPRTTGGKARRVTSHTHTHTHTHTHHQELAWSLIFISVLIWFMGALRSSKKTFFDQHSSLSEKKPCKNMDKNYCHMSFLSNWPPPHSIKLPNWSAWTA